MHTGPRGPSLFGWCTHYVPTTSHQPLATFHTAPTPPHTLRCWLHCHIWTCLEDFSPQTSPSGTIYPMVGVPSMCPPHQFSQFPTSGHLCGPTWTRFFAYLALHSLCTTLRTLLCTFAHPSTHLHAPPCTSMHLCTSLHTSMHPCTTFCTSLSRASHPYQTFQLASDPFGYPGQLSPSATVVGRKMV